MISQEKIKILVPLQKLPKNVDNLGKFIVAKGFEKLSKVHNIAQCCHTDHIQLLKKFYNIDPTERMKRTNRFFRLTS